MRYTILMFYSCCMFLCIMLGSFFYFFEKEWIDVSRLESFTPAQPSVVLDDEGKEFTRFALDRRVPVHYDQLPDVLIKAFVATEDHDFFSHIGISVKGIIRSMLVNLSRGRIVQGASTITQQVARGMFLSRKQTFLRKAQEAFISFQLERHFTKKQILELYLNNMYFGRGIYGVEAACRRFWDKPVKDVTVDEAATLAAVAKSAKLYSPLNAPERAKKRRNVNLRSMRKLGFISKEQYEEAREKPIVLRDYVPGNVVRLYIREHIRKWAEKKWGKDTLYKKGLQIKTTINIEKQRLAEEIFCKKITELRKQVGEQLNGGMLSIQAHTGKIKVCIGGYNFRESQYNRAFQAVRQMGSSFKPIVYTAAIQQGISMDTVMIDEAIQMDLPGCQKTWKPKNWTNRFDGPMTLARALAYSNNIITIKTLLKAGIKNVVALAKLFGISRAITEFPSLALGTAEAKVKENVAAFNVFANNGVYVEPYMVAWVKDAWGRKIWEYEGEQRRVLDSKTNGKMVNALSMRLKKMKAVHKNWIDAEVIGKTGSTNEAVSTWYVGATPTLTTAVYLGRDDNKPMGKYVFGSQTAYPIWLDFYKRLTFTKKRFYIDPELKEVAIDWVSGFETRDVRNQNTVLVLR